MLNFFLILLDVLIDLLSSESNPRLQILVLKDNPRKLKGGLQFEVENVGGKSTMLYPVINAVFITVDGERQEMVFDVDQTDLLLTSFTPRRFNASARKLQIERELGHDRRYCFDYGEGAAIEIEFNG